MSLKRTISAISMILKRLPLEVGPWTCPGHSVPLPGRRAEENFPRGVAWPASFEQRCKCQSSRPTAPIPERIESDWIKSSNRLGTDCRHVRRATAVWAPIADWQTMEDVSKTGVAEHRRKGALSRSSAGPKQGGQCPCCNILTPAVGNGPWTCRGLDQGGLWCGRHSKAVPP